MKLNNGFPILYADPPWLYDNAQDHDPARGGTPYPQLSVRNLCSLRPLIDRVVAKDSSLLMWATIPKLLDALQVMAAWGFAYRCAPFAWVKLNPTGSIIVPEHSKDIVLKGGVFSGLGSWTKGNVELVLMGKRGRPKRYAKNVSQVVFAPVGSHSAKPEEVRTRINRAFGDIPGLELFARPPKVKGWLKLGLEMTGKDIKEDLQELIDGT